VADHIKIRAITFHAMMSDDLVFSLSLPPVVCRRAHVLFTLFVFFCRRHMSYLRYLCLFVGGHMSYLRYLCFL
jgi:hypothetical protein